MNNTLTPQQQRAFTAAGLTGITDAQQRTAADVLEATSRNYDDFAQIALALHRMGFTFQLPASPERRVNAASPIETLNLSNSSTNKLLRAGIMTVDHLCDTHPEFLMGQRGVGTRTLSEVYIRLAAVGRDLLSAYDTSLDPAAIAASEPDGPVRIIPSSTLHDLAAELAEHADVLSHLGDATVADVLTLLDDTVLNLPARDLLAHDPVTTNVSARVAHVLQLLSARDLDVIRRRLPVNSRETLEAIASEYGISRERVRQIELRVAEKLAEDPLIAALCAQLTSLSFPMPLAEFTACGFDLSEDTGAVLLAGRFLGYTDRTTMLKVFEHDPEPLVALTNSTTIGSATDTIISRMLPFITDRPGSFGQRETLIAKIHEVNPNGPLSDTSLNAILTDLPVLFLDGRYISYAHSRRRFVEAAVELLAPVSAEVIEDLFDRVYPPETPRPASFDRRVTSHLHASADTVPLGDGTWSHTAHGAEPPMTVADRMEKIFLELDTTRLTMNTLLHRMLADDPSTKASTVRAYAAGGIRFHEADGCVVLGPSPTGSKPEMSESMFVTSDGLWAWHSIRDDDAMYYASTVIPAAFLTALNMTYADLVDGRTIAVPDGGPNGEPAMITVGASANACYLTSRGGFRDVLDAAGIQDGDRFRLVVTGPAEVRCEPLNAIDPTNPVTVLASFLGLPNDGSDPSDAVIEAVGLSPASFNPDTLRRYINLRGEQFSEAYWAINPEDSDDIE